VSNNSLNFISNKHTITNLLGGKKKDSETCDLTIKRELYEELFNNEDGIDKNRILCDIIKQFNDNKLITQKNDCIGLINYDILDDYTKKYIQSLIENNNKLLKLIKINDDVEVETGEIYKLKWITKGEFICKLRKSNLMTKFNILNNGEKLENIINKLLPSIVDHSSFKEKYIKYKNKYIELKKLHNL